MGIKCIANRTSFLRLAIATAALAALVACPPHPSPPPAATPGPPDPTHAFVRGFMIAASDAVQDTAVASVPRRGLPDNLYIPDVKVTLKNLNCTLIGPILTDLSGRFNFPPPGAGQYLVCWTADGYVPGCTAKPIVVDRWAMRLPPIAMAVQRDKTSVAIWGHVQFADGSVPRTLDAFAGVNAFAHVAAVDSSGTELARVTVNNAGDYVLPHVAVDNVRVTAQLEGAQMAYAIDKRRLQMAAVHRVLLQLPNHPPVLEPLFATVGARRALARAAGDEVTANAVARDEDGDPLTYRWIVEPGGGSVVDPAAPRTAWKLGLGANPMVRVVVSDGKGGYASATLTVSTDQQGILFAGKVAGTDVPAVAGAEVEIGGATVTTNAAGYFTVRVPEATRYVMNIRKPGYALVSKIYDGAISAGQWTLIRGTTATFDPRNAIELVDGQRERCQGSRTSRLDRKAIDPRLLEPRSEDGRHHVIPTQNNRDTEAFLKTFGVRQPCGAGISVKIPANSLVDPTTGQPPPPGTMVEVSVATADLRAPDGMPGDYTADGGKYMESYGAGFVEARVGGTRLQPTAPVTLTLPVDPVVAAAGAPPPQIPLMVYDERTGSWQQQGVLGLQGNAYVTQVRHFSTFNADTLKTGQACVKVLTTGLPSTFDLEVTIPQTSGAPKVITHTMDNSTLQAQAIYNLPLNATIALVPIAQIANPAVPGGVITGPLGVYYVNTGPAPQSPQQPNAPSPDGPIPYAACKVVVDLLVPPGTPPTPPPDAFLQGLYTFTAVNLTENGAPASPNALAQAVDAATNSYYAHVDPPIGGVSSRDTLAKFITHNQFSSEIHAIYTNTIDLGFGRDMHCTSNLASDNETDYACYVINHGSYATDDHADFEAAVTDAVPPGTVKAAVAMEYARIEDPNSPGSFEPVGRVMKFFVYLFDNGGNTTRINAANLDGLGDRPVPQLCMVCHAGSLPSPGAGAPPGSAPGFATAADVNLGSVFLPFDLSGFTFEDGFNPTFNRLAQEPAFKSLNQNIVFNATSPAIKEIITKMYAGNPPEQNALFVVDGWNNQLGNAGAPDPAVQRFYKNVIGTSCRGCHAAQPPTGVNSRKIEFNNAADFIPLGSQVDSYVCSQHVMPHALATYNRFWTNLYPLGSLLSLAPAELKIFGDAYMPNASHTQFNGCGLNVTTTQQPGLPVYNTVGTTPGIDQIFDNHCGFSGCHNGSGAGLPGVMHLGTGQFGQIVDVTSIQAPPMKRVKSTGTRVDSYLWHKIDGSQVAAGGSGSRMPLGPPLNPGDPERTLIEAWLDAGAPLQ